MPSPSSSSSEPTTTLVVVVNCNNAALTERCVRALDASTGGVPFDVLVVDNGSDDDSVARLRAGVVGGRLLPLPDNRGFGAGVNAAIRHRRAEHYVLVNNDAVPSPDFVAALVSAADRSPTRVGAFTARLELEGRFVRVLDDDSADDDFVSADGCRWRRAPEGVTLVNSTGNVLDASGNGQDRDWLSPVGRPSDPAVFGFSGGGALLRASALDEIGLFDESLFMYYEDTELSWRLAESGHLVRHVPDAVVMHRHSASSGTSSRLFVYYNTRNRIKVAVWHASPGTAARAILRTLARLLTAGSPRAASTRAVRDGLVAAVRDLPADLARRRTISRRAGRSFREIDPRTGLPDAV